MFHADLHIAAKRCQAMRDLIVLHPGGRADAESLSKFQHMTAAAAPANEDRRIRKRLEDVKQELAGAGPQNAGGLWGIPASKCPTK